MLGRFVGAPDVSAGAEPDAKAEFGAKTDFLDITLLNPVPSAGQVSGNFTTISFDTASLLLGVT